MGLERFLRNEKLNFLENWAVRASKGLKFCMVRVPIL
jgi:hypothetical protein